MQSFYQFHQKMLKELAAPAAPAPAPAATPVAPSSQGTAPAVGVNPDIAALTNQTFIKAMNDMAKSMQTIKSPAIKNPFNQLQTAMQQITSGQSTGQNAPVAAPAATPAAATAPVAPGAPAR
jgi:hypothetical protein